MKLPLQRLWREWIKPFALFFIIMAPLRSAVVDWNWVPTGSMEPTILEGDLVAVNKLAYDLKVPFTTNRITTWSEPARGEIAVFFSPEDGTRLVKRVVGLPGDTVELRNEVLFLKGVAQHYAARDPSNFLGEITEDKEPLIAIEHLDLNPHLILVLPNRPAMRTFGPHTVPPDHYFMMGDSRDNSNDSRFYGSVAREKIVGRAGGVILSLDLARYLQPRFYRFGRSFESLVLQAGL